MTTKKSDMLTSNIRLLAAVTYTAGKDDRYSKTVYDLALDNVVMIVRELYQDTDYLPIQFVHVNGSAKVYDNLKDILDSGVIGYSTDAVIMS